MRMVEPSVIPGDRGVRVVHHRLHIGSPSRVTAAEREWTEVRE
jgi:hypothetical protein